MCEMIFRTKHSWGLHPSLFPLPLTSILVARYTMYQSAKRTHKRTRQTDVQTKLGGNAFYYCNGMKLTVYFATKNFNPLNRRKINDGRKGNLAAAYVLCFV